MEESAQTSDGGAPEARVGQLLRGKWRLDALLGTGGMAHVYAATHRNGRRGAVKVLHVEMAVNADVRARFLREGYVANKVGHPGAVAVLDDDQTDDGAVFLVMELLEGQTVHALAQTRPGERLDVREVSIIADHTLDVLASAHDRGIVHRDLKPENLFLTHDGKLKVLDFGIARLLDGSNGSIATQAGSLYGTPAFMPPEQARGLWDEVDARSDLWSLGATLFTLLTGREVHVRGRTLNELMLAAMSDPAPSVRSLTEVPESLAHVIDRALAFEQAERWTDARAMQTALRSAYEQSFGAPLHADMTVSLASSATHEAPTSSAARQVSTTRSRAPARTRWLWPGLCVAAVAVALVAALLVSRRRGAMKEARPTPAALPVTPVVVVPSPRAVEAPHDAAVALDPSPPRQAETPAAPPKRRPRVAPPQPTGFVPPTLER